MTTIRRDENGQVDEIVSGDTHFEVLSASGAALHVGDVHVSIIAARVRGKTVLKTLVRQEPKPTVTHVDDRTAIIEAGTRVYVYARIRKGKAWLQIIEEDKQ